MTIIPANNTLIGGNTPGATSDDWKESLQGNLYPGTSENHELTDESTPSSVVFTGGYMSKPIYDIEETEDDCIVLKFNPLGTLPEVNEPTAIDVTGTEVTLKWDAVEYADAYNIKVMDNFDDVLFQIDSISPNSYHLEGLDEKTSYMFSVQAIADKYRNSLWSEPVQFYTTEDIDGLTNNFVEDNHLVRVYDMNGFFVTECKVHDINRLNVRSGIYIIRYGNGKIRKMLITL
jgi:hypothetical protein